MDLSPIENIKIKLKSIREKMSTFDAYFSKGLELYDKKNFKLAIKSFKLALQQSNAQNFANYNLALAYQQTNDFENALKCYEKFLQEFPEDQSSLYNIALMYFNKKDYDKSGEYFLKSFLIKPDEATTQAITQTFLKSNKTEELLKFIDEIFTNPKYDKNLAYVAAKEMEISAPTLSDKNLINKVLEIYLRLLEVEPRHFEALISVSLEYGKMGDWTNATLYCQKALKEHPNSFRANNQMGLTYYCGEDFVNSILFYEKAFKINSKTEPKIYSNLAYAYEKVGREEEALKLLKDLIIKFPNCPEKEIIKKQAYELNQKIKKN